MGFHNAEAHLAEALESLERQTCDDFEAILIDDASTDLSSQIAAAVAERDTRFKLFRNERNCGLTHCLNRAWSLSDGEFVARLDADDVAATSRLAVQYAFLCAHPKIDILGTWATDIDEYGQSQGMRKLPESHDQIVKALAWYNPIVHPAVMMRRHVLEQLDGYALRFRTSQDYDLWFRAAAAGFSFANLAKPLVLYRTGSNYTARKSGSYRLNEFKIRLRGTRGFKTHWYDRVSVVLSLMLAVLPKGLFQLVKRFDPRNG